MQWTVNCATIAVLVPSRRRSGTQPSRAAAIVPAPPRRRSTMAQGFEQLATPDRRRFVTRAAAGLAGLALLPGNGARAATGVGAHPFTLGVASGDPTPDGAVLWTRLAPRPLEADGGMPDRRVAVRWWVAEDERMRRVVRHGTALAVPELAHSVHVEVEGLRPGRDYYYRFAAGGEESAVARTRTAPPR